jgi:TolB-like protein
MQIWSTEIKEIERLYNSTKGQSPALEKELERLINASDENMVLVYARRCLEVIVTDLCECELRRPRKTEPLQGIIDKLNREEKIPSHIFASMLSLNSQSTFGSHPKEFDPRQVKPVLVNLTTIIEWYLKYKNSQTISQAKPEEAKYEGKEPVDTKKDINKPKKKLILLFSGLLVVMAIVVVLLVFNIIGGERQTKEIEKSIAVLPFINDSQDEENTYFINGIMEEVLLNLQTIKDLRVPGRTSVEQYRNPTKSIPEIARELGVSYIVEGSGQKYGNKIVLRIQLLEGAKDRHLWGESYEQKIGDIEDIIRIQSQIAQSIANELKAIITPEEKQLIEKIPTTNLTAYDFYERGKDELTKYEIDNNNKAALEKAEDLYNEALKYDSTFAQVYTGLARVYRDKHYFKDYLSEDFLDSVLILCNIALSYDDQISEAYTTRGDYYREFDKPEKVLEEYDKAIKLNPNDWMAYLGKGEFYARNDFVNNIKYLQKAISLNRGPELPALLEEIGGVYSGDAGFPEKAKQYYLDKLKLDSDSLDYYSALASDEFFLANFSKSIEFGIKGYAIDSTNEEILQFLGINYAWLGRYEESLKYYKKWLERLKTQDAQAISSPFNSNLYNNMHRIGYSFWQSGYKKEAEYYFSEQINYCNRMIDSKRLFAQTLYPYYDLAGVYAFRGDRVKAYENLKIFNQRKIEPLWMVILIKKDPLFNSIRNEPEFQQIVRDVEAKYQAEHERVRKWLEEQGML